MMTGIVVKVHIQSEGLETEWKLLSMIVEYGSMDMSMVEFDKTVRLYDVFEV